MNDAGGTRYVPRSLSPSYTLDTKEVEIVRWVKEELANVSAAISSLEYQYPPLSQLPGRVAVGMIVYADATLGASLGSGEGLYIYKSGGWTFIV